MSDSSTVQSKRFTVSAGIILLLASFVFYGALLFVPFLPFSSESRMLVAICLVVLGEVSFWIGCLVSGREVMSKHRGKFRLTSIFKKLRK